MKTAVALTIGAAFALSLLAVTPAAQAKLTPHDGLTVATPADVETSDTSSASAGAQLERDYFTAPVEAQAEPAASPYRAGRCTVKAIVFEKMRLAQACY